jgi:NAD dependent epimerase/dehydratase family enzyme
MKIVIPGGSGQVGTLLARAFAADGHEVVVLSREPSSAPWRTVRWDAHMVGEWAAELEGADAVINLAGRSVNCRYTPANRRAILESRVHSTRAVGEAIARCARPPRVWLQASTATIYSHRFDAANDEATGMIGGGEGARDSWKFSIEVARAWEGALAEADTPATRKVALRGLGGRAGSGRQFVSWVHEADFVRALRWLMEHDEVDGAVNISSPRPLPYDDFMRALRQAWGTRIGLPATEWMLAIGTRVMRTETELVLKSRRVVPGRLLEGGFEFHFPHWPEAARDLVARWRRGG